MLQLSFMGLLSASFFMFVLPLLARVDKDTKSRRRALLLFPPEALLALPEVKAAALKIVNELSA
jgi:hypothetical protein